MYGSIEMAPPKVGSDLLRRPRLLRFLAERWEHRVTSVVGGAGLGKTTLLAQALAENRLAPRGRDIWVSINSHGDDASHVAAVVTSALANGFDEPDHGDPDSLPASQPRDVANLLWRRSPTQTCLVFDDVHRVPSGSPGAAWLAQLTETLPSNGHIVLASRSEPPIPLSRYGAQGSLLRVTEEHLRFSDEELVGFATHCGLDPGHFHATAGWPAMAALAARVGPGVTNDYLWEEVLKPLGTLRRHVLALLCDLGGGDEELLSAAIGDPLDLSRLLDGIPLVSQRADGWYTPHRLWASAPGLELAEDERAESRRRAAGNLISRHRFDEAFTLAQEAGLPGVMSAVLRAACIDDMHLVASQLNRWLAASPAQVKDSRLGRLATTMHTALTAPDRAEEPLRTVVSESQEAEDPEAELAALSSLILLGWWQQDMGLLAQMIPRIVALDQKGHPRAQGLATVSRAALADLGGDADALHHELSPRASASLEPVWKAYAGWLEGSTLLNAGRPDAALEAVDRLDWSDPASGMRSHYVLDSARICAWWAKGDIDWVLDMVPSAYARARHAGHEAVLYFGQALASMIYSYLGDTTMAASHLDLANHGAPPTDSGTPPVAIALATASVRLAEGDEARAGELVRQAVVAHGVDQGIPRHMWRHTFCLSYILAPATRAHWDQAPLRGHLHTARLLSAAVAELRETGATARLQSLDLPSTSIIRTALHHRFVAELAVGLASIGRPEGYALLDAVGPMGREAVRDLTHSQPRLSKSARALLAAMPAPPPQPSFLAALGPIVLRRNGPDDTPVVHPELRRPKVQTLLAFLITNRRTTRSAVTAALWPDLDERSGANNLSVTLNHLLRILEPWRAAGEPAYLLRVDGPTIHLVTDEHLQLDTDSFDEHLSAAHRAESDGIPSLALEHYLAAIRLYRGNLYADLSDADWFELDREHYRLRFIATANRAGQLLLGQGDTHQAQEIAHRALTIDPWSEDAHTILVSAALDRSDRTTAHRMLHRCLATLEELGVSPSSTTQELQHRLQDTYA